jgi:hypothetical protein
MASRDNYHRLKEAIMHSVLDKHMDSLHEEVKKSGGTEMPLFQSIGITRVEIYRAAAAFLEAKGITEEEFACWVDEVRRRANETLLTEKLDEIIEDQKLGNPDDRKDNEGEEWKKI